MEQKFNNNRLDLQVLRDFCEREGEESSSILSEYSLESALPLNIF